MKITEIKATIVAGSRPWVYVRVATDEGLYGLAEAYPIRGVIDVLHSQLEELLIGQDPLVIEPLYNRLLARTPGQSTGGTTLAVTINLLKAGTLPKDESIVVCITGNGYKTANVMANRLTKPTMLGRSLREFEAFLAERAGQSAEASA